MLALPHPDVKVIAANNASIPGPGLRKSFSSDEWRDARRLEKKLAAAGWLRNKQELWLPRRKRP
jgi:hypothetical protein